MVDEKPRKLMPTDISSLPRGNLDDYAPPVDRLLAMQDKIQEEVAKAIGDPIESGDPPAAVAVSSRPTRPDLLKANSVFEI